MRMPIAFMLSTSFKYAHEVYDLNLIPREPTLDNYLRDELGGLTGARLLLAGAAIVIGLLLFEAQLLLKPKIVVPVVAALALLGATARTACSGSLNSPKSPL